MRAAATPRSASPSPISSSRHSRSIATVRRMAVFGDAGSSLAFSPPSGDALAWIVEAARLNAAIEEAVASRPWIRLRRGVAAKALGARADGAWIELEEGSRLE